MFLEIGKTLLALLLIRGVQGECTSRRCLAEMLIKKNLKSQPQSENCSLVVDIPLLEYQTLAVSTKDLRLFSRLEVTLQWTDPDLAWDTSLYEYKETSIPVKSVWTPELHVTNAIAVKMEPTSKDLVVLHNGTLRHTINMIAELNCEINLFNYPFAADSCPLALHTWYSLGCGGQMLVHELKAKDGAHGDWKTESISLSLKGEDQNYISVDLKLRQINPFITLMLPSILIILADVVSFALPLGGGERNSFKVTLVLSFTMFLVILNNELPGDSTCSPVIRMHFCVCLNILVFSMLISMILTRVAKEGRLSFCCCSKWQSSKDSAVQDEENTPDVSVVQVETAEEHIRMLRKVVSFLEAQDAKEKENGQRERLADTLDKTFFWFYLLSSTSYFIAIIYVMVNQMIFSYVIPLGLTLMAFVCCWSVWKQLKCGRKITHSAIQIKQK